MAAITTAIAVAGLAASSVGTYGQYQAGKSSAASAANIAEYQMQQEALRKRAMELDARRRTLQTIRQAQIARATATSTAVAQNAQAGSVLQGAYGQISGQEGTNLVGINQGLQLGEQNFALNAGISQERLNMAQYQSNAATYSGLSSFGQSLQQAAPTLGKIAQGFTFGNPYGQSYNPNYGYNNSYGAIY